MNRYAVSLVVGLACLGAGAAAWLMLHRPAERRVSFNDEIRPILNRSCIGCHGGVKKSGNFSVQFREEAFAAGESGKHAIVPGHPDDSELIRRILLPASDPEHMPRRGIPVSAAEAELLQAWIKQGASWETHWAYVAPRKPAPPRVASNGWPINDIDRFVLARIESRQLTPAEPASCPQLMRRVSLDLTGLPPQWERVRKSCEETRPQNYEQYVDELLASPAFGERWATMWLDLARYADSMGVGEDQHRTLWPYRDWIIRAFNADMPFDQFTIEQLAGDLLPDPTTDQLIATAYHRMTPTIENMDMTRVESVMDRVSNTWETWQGQTMGCARCHSHTYDPFRQSDYYHLVAFFNNTEEGEYTNFDGSQDQTDEWPAVTRFSPEQQGEGDRLLAQREALRWEMLQARDRPDVVAQRIAWDAMKREHRRKNPGMRLGEGFTELTVASRYFPNDIGTILVTEPGKRTPYDASLLADFYAEEVAPQFVRERQAMAALGEKIAALKRIEIPVTLERPQSMRRPTFLLVRGVWNRPDLQRPMAPDVPESMPPLVAETQKDRLALARWLVDARNPLTARVTVNRLWAQLFGRGIVATPGNFGTQGSKPANPELLDWLAWNFQHEMHWSVKRILRTMVMSATYRQSSAVGRDKYDQDPSNEFLSRGPRVRLSAEALRDQSLAVSGLLNPEPFGPPVPFSALESKHASTPMRDRHRRSIYGIVRRKNLYSPFESFDHPTRVLATSQRVSTNSPLHALITLNDPTFVEATEALALRMREQGGTPREQVAWAFRQVLLREPAGKELAMLEAPYMQPDMAPPAASRLVANVLLNLDSVITKE